MAKFIIQGLLLITAAALMVEASVSVGVTAPTGRRRSVEIQGLPYGCQAEVDVEKRDGSEDVAFVVCVKSGTVCTSQSVAACSDDAKDCESFKPPADEDFAMMFPEAYAKVCEEESGELCLYTDVEYDMCEEAKTMNENEICITLSNGEVECSEIPLKYRLQSEVQSDNKLPPYRPTARVNGAKAEKQYWPGPYAKAKKQQIKKQWYYGPY